MANIVVCSDGTWNRPEEDLEKDFPTNVLKLARAVDPGVGNAKQHVFYDWGLGSYHSSLSAGATGRGIHKNPLDKYKPAGEAAVGFRDTCCHRSNKVHFVGVWDTVGALGIPFSIMGLFDRHDEFYDTKMGSNVSFARHALAIDEKREDFEPTIWTSRPGVDLKQVWFAGVHSDVGGSYPPDRETGIRASDTPLEWMLDEAEDAGLQIEPHIKDCLTDGAKGKIHQSRNHVYRFKSPLLRPLIVEGKPVKIHPSVKTRYMADKNYRPPELKKLVEQSGWDHLDVGT